MDLLERLKKLVSSNRVDISKRFALLREAISGTMSKFYMARDLRTGQIVGLKILDIKKTAEFEARFRGLNKPTEGEIAMYFKHPRIVETFEHGLTTEGAQYIVMEFIEGRDVNSMIIGHDPCLEGNRVQFIREAAEAVAAIHAAGFIHRDVSPRNFLVLKGTNDLKMIDFGVTLPATPQFCQPGVRTGNPNYMAPEIVRRKHTDPRVDVFAFGTSAYEICTGELPWLKGTTGMVAMTHDKPPTDLHKYRPQINSRLAKAIHWCLEADVAKRCPSMEQFLQAIKDIATEDGE
jgi:eukaryotic-like serine/threonine-protein kinase